MFKRLDQTARGIFLMALLVLVESTQLVIVLGLLSRFFPLSQDSFNADLFPVYKSSLKPNHQMLIYHIFILASLMAQAISIYSFRRKLEEPGFQKNIKQLLCVDALWIFIQLFAVFKILIYNSPAWAWEMFYISLAASFLSRIFWGEIKGFFFSAGSQFLEVDSRFRGNDTTIAVIPAKGRIDRHSQLLAGIQEIFWLPLLVLAGSIQMIIAANWLMGPNKARPIFLFGMFILSSVIGSWWISFKNIRIPQLKPFIVMESLLTFFLLSALYKMVIYDYRNQLATNAYHVLLVLALLNKIFWPGVWRWTQEMHGLLVSRRNRGVLTALGDCLMVGLIVAMVYLPDPQAVLAKMFVGEQFHHMNHFIMAPGWAWVSGCVLDVDVISRYGIGVPIVLSTLAKCLRGDFSYLNILLVIMWVCIIYYVLCYLFLRLWFKSLPLAAAAILMGIKVQMFYTLTLPQPLTYASGTPVRFMFDLAFMFCIWRHLSTRQLVYLWLAALSCGVSLFYMLETGLYLTAAFGGYLIMLGLIPALRREVFASRREQAAVATCFISVPLTAFLLYVLVVGHHALTASFWHKSFEFSKYFTGGLFTGPFYGGLQYGQFWDLLIGFLFPIVYILTILVIGALCVIGKISPKHLMVVIICIYGLGAHHYYISLPTANNYYMRGLPFVFVCFYWIRLGLYRLNRYRRRRVEMFLVFFSFYALWTNHHYLAYPNVFNFSRNPMVDPLVAEELPTRKPYLLHKVWDVPESQKLPFNSLGQKDEGLRRDFASDEELKAYYAQESQFPQDAHLIRSFTAANDPVALISSFEIDMLMQADRKPLFYYFSLTFSRPLRMRNFGDVEIFTHGQLTRLIDQLKGSPSPYVFMERIFLDRHVPDQYYNDNPGLMGLLDYVNSQYRPYQYGKYLVAMKRN